MVIVWTNNYLRAVSTMYKIHFSSFLKQTSRCYTKFYFSKSGGGAQRILPLFLTAAMILLSIRANAQTPPTGCNHWEIEICADVKPPANIGQNCGPNAFPHNPCDAVYYYIYLSKTGSQNNINDVEHFAFVEFNLSGSVIVTPNTLATSRVLSTINVTKSLDCSPAGLNAPNDPASPLYALDDLGPTNKKFSFKVIDSGAAVDWDVYGRRLLCVLAIDAFPGEIIELGALSANVKFYNGNICTLPIDGCDAPIPSFQVPVSDACTGVGLRLRQGQAVDDPIPGYPKRKKIPVYAFSFPTATTVLQRLDFLMRVSGAMQMTGVSIEPGLFQAKALDIYDESAGANINKRIFADFRDVTVEASSTPTPENTLFYILLDGPVLSSDCGTTTVAFTDYRRLQLASNGYCCQPSVTGLPQDVEWSSSPCPDHCTNLEVRAKEASSIPQNADPCHSVFFDVDIKSSTTKTYTEGTVRVEVKYSGTLTWSASSSFSSYCSNLGNCVEAEQVGPGLLQLTFSIDGITNINLTGTQPNNLIRFGFDATDACIEAVVFRDAIFTEQNATLECLPNTVSEVNSGVLSDDICITSLTMTYELHFGPEMQEVEYRVANQAPSSASPNLNPFTCERIGFAVGKGSSAICACDLPNEFQWVYPSKDDNPLNGVTTYDLVLISKHILGLELLDSPYKLIAADANKSGSITTFDIVELRKLILGIYGTPTAPWIYPSYRFVDKSFSFPNPLNPFQTAFPEYVRVTVPPLGAVAAFKGVKIGDVNNNAIGANLLFMEDRDVKTTPLGFVSQQGRKGQIVRVPVFTQDILECNAWQMEIGYDPSEWNLTNVIWTSPMGEIPERHWQTQSLGSLRLMAYSALGDLVRLPKGIPLFYLEGELLKEVDNLTIHLEDTRRDFSSEVYSTSGNTLAFSLEMTVGTQMTILPPLNEEVQQKEIWSAEVYPNPAGRAFRVQVLAPENGKCTIRFFSPLGQRVAEYAQNLVSGENVITSTNFPELEVGQYILEVETSWGKKLLRLVKN